MCLSCCAQAPVQVLVDKEAAADVYNMRPDDMVSVGPFEGTGLDLRSSGVLGLFRWVAALGPVHGRACFRWAAAPGPVHACCISGRKFRLVRQSDGTQGFCSALATHMQSKRRASLGDVALVVLPHGSADGQLVFPAQRGVCAVTAGTPLSSSLPLVLA